MTPEEKERQDEKWEYICSLSLSKITGKFIGKEEYEAELHELEKREAKEKRCQQERENIRDWKRLDLETLNTLMIQYQQTGDEQYFNQAWDKYLKRITGIYFEKYVVRGLSVTAKQLFLYDYQNYYLRDVLYPVLIETIKKWEPNNPSRNTLDFAAYFKQAVRNFTGNINNRYNHKIYQHLYIKKLDFNDEEEVNILLQSEPSLKQQLDYSTNLELKMNEKNVDEFIETMLTKEQKILLNLLMIEKFSVVKIAQYMKITRMTVYRKIEKIRIKWEKYKE